MEAGKDENYLRNVGEPHLGIFRFQESGAGSRARGLSPIALGFYCLEDIQGAENVNYPGHRERKRTIVSRRGSGWC